MLALKTELDNAFIEIKAKQKGMTDIPKIVTEFQGYPIVVDRMLQNLDAVVMFGSLYLVLLPLASFMVIFDEMAREKIDNLRRGMQLLGTLDSAYWVSWIITSITINFYLAAGAVFFGRLEGFPVFERTPAWLWVLILFFTGTAYANLGFFLVTIVRTRLQGFIVNLAVILSSLITNMVLAEPTVLKKIFFNTDNIAWIEYVSNCIYLWPCFQLGKMFGDIAAIVAPTFNLRTLHWESEARDFVFEDIYAEQTGSFFTGDRYHVTSMYSTFITLIYTTAFYGVLAWYFDHTIASNRGVPEKWWFPVSRKYWVSILSSITNTREVALSTSPMKVAEEEEVDKKKTALHEQKMIERDELLIDSNKKKPFFDGVRAIGLSKSYTSVIGNSTIKALREVFFEIQRGELLGIMGHNGAGKTTLINVLCGLVNRDEGNARCFEHDIESSLQHVRKRMGVVSQFDVLWDELTGIEHMHLFQTLKRVDISNFDQLVKQRLADVGLQESGNLMVGKYSGGMRRRISVALATMGNPSVILMDEPTTGMDPVSRRHVWTLIQRLKMNKAILMTTHAMEEAELLSDKIIVLNHGRCQCVGSPLQLKNIFGNGYRISMICGQNRIAEVLHLMKKIAPAANFLETSGDSGGLVFNITFEHVKQLGNVFFLLDKKNPAVGPKA